jgi:hypothetical protein
LFFKDGRLDLLDVDGKDTVGNFWNNVVIDAEVKE